MPLGINVIDMDDPSKRIPKDWEVRPEDQLKSRIRGQIEWNQANTSLHLSKKQRASYSDGHDLKKDLEGQPVYSDAVVDLYLDHPEVPTPKEWKGKWIFCWGRVYYRPSHGYLIVRCLYCHDGGSRSGDYSCLDDEFYSYDPSLVAGK